MCTCGTAGCSTYPQQQPHSILAITTDGRRQIGQYVHIDISGKYIFIGNIRFTWQLCDKYVWIHVVSDMYPTPDTLEL